MAPAGKALGFYNEANDWFCNAELPSDLIVIIDGVNFNLHKFPLLSRCGEIEKLIKETQDNDKGTCIISLEDIPGGANGFLVAAKFCYGVHVELTPRNIVMVYCLADYLEMIDEYGDDNLFSKAGNYFYKNVLKNWKDCMVALQSCEILETKIDNLNIVGKCLDAITVMVCRDPSLFGWPMMMYGHLQSPGGSILWNGINTGAIIQTPETDWWFEDVSHLRVALFEKLIKTMEAKGIQPENLTGAVMYYCGKCLPGLGRWQGGQSRSAASHSKVSDINDQKALLENIVELLPQTKGKSICRFLLGLLRVGLILDVSDKCRDSLEKRIGMQLEFASLDGLMIPSYSDSDTLYNTNCVQRMIDIFLTSKQNSKTLPSPLPLKNVSKLVDRYMAEIASDVNLKPEKIHSLAEALPQSSRSLNDGLYRAVDIYIEAHPWLTEKKKEDLCNIINCQKLSIDACAHASQNEHLPLRFALQVLFFEQLHLKTALEGYLNLLDIENNQTDPMAIVPHDSHRYGWVSLVRENQVIRDGMERMRTRVHELEQEFNSLRQKIKMMSQAVVL
uniref:BTB/POZ domain-containing protein At3g44820-like n=1 Tax=Erigeron canadensis TaxID=72917 RepID=UPI001CB8DE5B|nr:BTB/POZ domain-containing protein At3g44820-like [Erigeron canadensis]